MVVHAPSPRLHMPMLLLAMIGLALSGCTSSSPPADLTEQARPSKATGRLGYEDFYGKWDLDGRRTNAMNGKAGLKAMPSNVYQNVMGEGWRFERNNVLLFDETGGSVPGEWKVQSG